MLKSIMRAAACVLPLMVSNIGYSIIDADVLLGKRWVENTTNNQTSKMSGTQTDVGARLEPIPLVPISFGLSLGITSYDVEEDANVNASSQLDVGLDVSAWLPIPGLPTPYAKVRYIPVSTLAFEREFTGQSESLKYATKGNGTTMAVGVMISPPIIPLLKILVEAQTSNMTYGEVEVDDLPEEVKSIVDFETESAGNQMMVGIMVDL